MNYTDLKKLSLRCFIAFLALTALVAIVSVLIGEFGELQGKIIATTFTISAASICSMSCAAWIEKKRLPLLGFSGIALSVLAAVLVCCGIWPDMEHEAYWKTTASVAVFAVAFAHAFLLVLPRLDARHKWLQIVSPATILLLAVLAVIAIWSESDNEIFLRILAVIAIVVGLETLVTPILMKLRRDPSLESERITIRRIAEGLYVDSAGRQYQSLGLLSHQPNP